MGGGALLKIDGLTFAIPVATEAMTNLKGSSIGHLFTVNQP
jgi:hypothetical protein